MILQALPWTPGTYQWLLYLALLRPVPKMTALDMVLDPPVPQVAMHGTTTRWPWGKKHTENLPCNILNGETSLKIHPFAKEHKNGGMLIILHLLPWKIKMSPQKRDHFAKEIHLKPTNNFPGICLFSRGYPLKLPSFVGKKII